MVGEWVIAMSPRKHLRHSDRDPYEGASGAVRGIVDARLSRGCGAFRHAGGQPRARCAMATNSLAAQTVAKVDPDRVSGYARAARSAMRPVPPRRPCSRREQIADRKKYWCHSSCVL